MSPRKQFSGLLRNILRGAIEAGPEAYEQVKRTIRSASPQALQGIQDAALTVGTTLQQNRNPAGKAILDALAPPGMAGRVQRASVQDVNAARRAAAANRLQQQRQGMGPPAPRPEFSVSDPRGRVTISPVTSGETRQLSLLPEGAGSGTVKLRYGAGVPDVNPTTGRRMGGQVYDPSLTGPSTLLPTSRSGGNLVMQTGPIDNMSLDEAIQRGLVTTNVPGAPSMPVGFARQRYTAPDLNSPRAFSQASEAVPASFSAAGDRPAPVPARDLRSIREAYGQGTVDSLENLAQAASKYYNRPISAIDLNAPFFKDFPSQASLEMFRRSAARTAAPTAAEVAADAAETAVRNAVGGTRKVDLNTLAKVLGGVGLTAGVGGLVGMGAYNMFGGGGPADAGRSPLPPGTGATDVYTPVDMGGVSAEAEDVFGGGSATGGVPGQTAPAVIRTNDAASNQRQAAANALAAAAVMQPNTPASYGNIGAYYQARGAYAAQPGVVGNLIEQLIQVDPRFDRPELQAWAASNPGLAYELLQNQQMPNLQQPEITTELGTNTENNAVGNSVEAANVLTDNMDPALRDATQPRLSVSIQRQPMYYTRPGFAGRI